MVGLNSMPKRKNLIVSTLPMCVGAAFLGQRPSPGSQERGTETRGTTRGWPFQGCAGCQGHLQSCPMSCVPCMMQRAGLRG